MSGTQKTKSKWAFELNMGALEYDGTTPCESWNIEIPLVGNYVPANLTNFDKVLSRVENFAKQNNLHFPKKDKEGPGGYARTAGAIAAESFPNLGVESEEMEAYIIANVGYWWFDDVTEINCLKNKTNLLANEGLSNISTILRNMYKGEYPNVADIPDSIPEFKPFILHHYHAWKVLVQLVPNFVDNVEPYILSNELWLKIVTLSYEANYYDNISLETYRYLRPVEVGFVPFLELGMLASRVPVRPEVRKHCLYDLILSLMSMTVGFSNDIVSLGRDISRGLKMNYVRILAEEEGLTLREAVYKTLGVIEKQTRDTELALKQLCQEFHNEPDVVLVADTLKDALNGCVVYYIHTERYGRKVGTMPYIRN